MRVPPMLSVEVAGRVERRHVELEVLMHDSTGRAAVWRLRPQLLQGEVLQERLGRIPAIIKEIK